MGSWSVACGISNIAITSGHKCVILPLKENKNSEYGGYVPATLPIFGEYDDYGGMDNIKKDKNTALIAKHFGVKIEEFVQFLVDGKYTYDRDEAKEVAEKMKKKGTFEEAEKLRFMWIDRNVYDFMIVSTDEYYKGYMDYGTPKMLKLLGFELVETGDNFKNYDPKRFNQKWKKGKLTMFSDGSTLLAGKSRYVYHFGHGNETSIETYFDVPEELHVLKNMSKYDAWRYMEPNKAKTMLGYIIGIKHMEFDLGYDFDALYEKMVKLKEEGKVFDWDKEVKLIKKGKKPFQPIHKEYLDNLETFGDTLAQLTNIRGNLYPMSGRFYPHTLYLTPQCGEFKQHQIILEKFAEINKSYIHDEE